MKIENIFYAFYIYYAFYSEKNSFKSKILILIKVYVYIIDSIIDYI